MVRHRDPGLLVALPRLRRDTLTASSAAIGQVLSFSLNTPHTAALCHQVGFPVYPYFVEVTLSITCSLTYSVFLSRGPCHGSGGGGLPPVRY